MESERERAELEAAIYERCRDSPEGADFLISSFVQSLRSYRRPTVCAPFPAPLFPKQGPLPDKDFAAAEDCIALLPSVAAIAGGGTPGGQLAARQRSPIEALPSRALRLLHWLLGAHRRRLRLLPDPVHELEGKLPPGRSPWLPPALTGGASWKPDFVLEVQELPTAAASHPFEEFCTRHGSFMAFHGTAAENLHSILRCGLIVGTGTQLQRNGAIHGQGIYLSPDLLVALGFCSAGEGWERSCFGSRARYMLLCEVARGPGVLLTEAEESRGAGGEGPTAPRGVGRSSARARSDPTAGAGSAVQIASPGGHVGVPVGARGSEGGAQGPGLGAYVLVQNSDLVKVRYVFVYREPARLVGARLVGTQPGGAGRQASALDSGARRQVDWCKAMIVAYVAVLLVLGLMKTDMFRHSPLLLSLGPYFRL